MRAVFRAGRIILYVYLANGTLPVIDANSFSLETLAATMIIACGLVFSSVCWILSLEWQRTKKPFPVTGVTVSSAAPLLFILLLTIAFFVVSIANISGTSKKKQDLQESRHRLLPSVSDIPEYGESTRCIQDVINESHSPGLTQPY
jgi:hypothetical protein